MLKRSTLSLIVTLLLGVANVFAQNLPVPSPAAEVKQTVGVTEISVNYSSPAVKGRTVFGELEKFGSTWRAGANGPTAITFSSDVMIDGKEVKAGTYNIFLSLEENAEWTYHFNGANKSIFAYNKDGKQDIAGIEADDVASFKTKPEAAPFRERLTYLIESVKDNEAKVTLWWDKTMVSFTVNVPTDKLAEANIASSTKNVWRTFQNSANFYASSNPEKALELIENSISLRPNYFWNNWVKAQILAGQEKYDEALTAAIDARKFGEAKPDGAYNYFKGSLNKDIETWMPNASKKWKKANKSNI
ncbi:DUF2911 domain-containing protein [Flammeovirga yaeyamensis]|uniref:DUF2911 domain-containing protein n=1 Tax=Flammeovirga yaeyamensis TaxID=367791 RepID=A0AAX1NCR7_9BACT|nr:DUF2911 domain-containing protein [Flammeovirga yaeyamensis]MBB3698703.1 tetratricopeptide (TPR) repeat protein [Flammeovirga yaeyamensis]NMF37290.1 DUF2911 domain-containing protein [Flammeovirga yaeyamensis]QWG03892.1 DUF2911 domain-containing protein [Flammeovirga yaeyamensis]